eukprot:scaffold286938_cov30-Attheya_sp.AAC.1
MAIECGRTSSSALCQCSDVSVRNSKVTARMRSVIQTGLTPRKGGWNPYDVCVDPTTGEEISDAMHDGTLKLAPISQSSPPPMTAETIALIAVDVDGMHYTPRIHIIIELVVAYT